MKKRKFNLSEEICRWAFEVHILQHTEWRIAFTNPTAGPWKRIQCTNQAGIVGEVYRFAREEDRPDLVLINDSLEYLLIIEAKDSLHKIASAAQLSKSALVVAQLLSRLRSLKDNPFWGRRSSYTCFAGLLFGLSDSNSNLRADTAFAAEFADELAALDRNISKDIPLIGVKKSEENGSLSLEIAMHHQNSSGNNLLNSFQIKKKGVAD